MSDDIRRATEAKRRSVARRLTRVRRHLHWWTAALLVIGFAIAWVMTALPTTGLLLKFLVYQLHKSLGLCVSGLAALRIVLAYQAGDHPRAVPKALYGLLLMVPLLGYLTAAASPVTVPTLFFLAVNVPHVIAPDQAVFDVIRPMHKWLAIALIALAACHGAQMYFGTSGSGRLRMARSEDAHPPAKPD